MFQTTVWAFRIGPGTDSERRHLDARFSMLPTGSPLTADAGFISYELCAELLRRSVHFVLPVGGNITLLTEVGGTHEVVGETVYLWPDKRQKQPPIRLRLIQTTTGKPPVYLLTDILDPAQLSDADAAELYRRR
ncbi:MAG: hypothetical protein NT013_02905 [Planctomycetia bacterium]|nr:hypothetical protein [Planctomycetia bacterium]